MIWVLFLILAIAAIVAALWPLFTQLDDQQNDAALNMAVYKDQLSQIDNEVERGVITVEDAKEARTEISRKLIAASEADDGQEQIKSDENNWLKPALAGIPILAMSIGLYQQYGQPSRPDMPLQARLDEIESKKTPEQRNIAKLINKVEQRLATTPDDIKGWTVLAPVLFREGQYTKAENAYRQILRLGGMNVRALSGLAETLVFQNRGKITEEAENAYRHALKLDPLLVVPRIRLAMAKEQQGKFVEARNGYQKIVDMSDKASPWMGEITKRLAFVSQKAGAGSKPMLLGDAAKNRGSSAGQLSTQAGGMSRRPRGSAPGQMAAPSPSQPGPTQEDIKNAAQMSAQDRSAMINQMVASLADKLKENGNDLKGWMQLMRAYKVLGKPKDAAQAYQDAQANFKTQPKALAALSQAARTLGIGS